MSGVQVPHRLPLKTLWGGVYKQSPYLGDIMQIGIVGIILIVILLVIIL